MTLGELYFELQLQKMNETKDLLLEINQKAK